MTRLLDSETNEPVEAEELGIDEQQYEGYVMQSQGIPGTGHIRVRVSPTGETRRVYAETAESQNLARLDAALEELREAIGSEEP